MPQKRSEAVIEAIAESVVERNLVFIPKVAPNTRSHLSRMFRRIGGVWDYSAKAYKFDETKWNASRLYQIMGDFLEGKPWPSNK